MLGLCSKHLWKSLTYDLTSFEAFSVGAAFKVVEKSECTDCQYELDSEDWLYS